MTEPAVIPAPSSSERASVVAVERHGQLVHVRIGPVHRMPVAVVKLDADGARALAAALLERLPER